MQHFTSNGTEQYQNDSRYSSCDPGGYRMARGWRYTNPSPASALLHIARVCECYLKAMHPFLCSGFPARLCIRPILFIIFILLVPIVSGISFLLSLFSFPFFLSVSSCFCFLCFRWSFVKAPLFFFFLSSRPRTPDWQPHILPGKVEAPLVTVKNTHTHIGSTRVA